MFDLFSHPFPLNTSCDTIHAGNESYRVFTLAHQRSNGYDVWWSWLWKAYDDYLFKYLKKTDREFNIRIRGIVTLYAMDYLISLFALL